MERAWGISAQVSIMRVTSRKASQSCSHRHALACAVHKYVQSTTRRWRTCTYMCVWVCTCVRVCVCTGNIIANKYLLPVAGSINIKEKLPKNWKLSLRTMREELLYSYCRFSRYFKRLYRSALWLGLKTVSKLVLAQLYFRLMLPRVSRRKSRYNSFNFISRALNTGI